MKKRVLGAALAAVLFMTSAGFSSNYCASRSGMVIPAAVASSAQSAAPRSDASVRSGSPPVANNRQALSLPDIIGIILFLALIVTHFFLCRKGVFPESSCLCEPPSWLKKMWTKANRGADS